MLNLLMRFRPQRPGEWSRVMRTTWAQLCAHDFGCSLSPDLRHAAATDCGAWTRFAFGLQRLRSTLEKEAEEARKATAGRRRVALQERLGSAKGGIGVAYRLVRSRPAPGLQYLVRDGKLCTSPLDLDACMRDAWGVVFEGAGPGFEVAASFFAKYGDDIYREPEVQLQDITSEELIRFLRRAGNTAAGLDGFWPAEGRLISVSAAAWLARLYNAVERGAAWPRDWGVARAAYLEKEGADGTDPLKFRPLLVLAFGYRLWAKLRLAALASWASH